MSDCILKAVGDTVLLKEIVVEETTNAGLVLSSKVQTPIYEIRHIGDKALKENLFTVGDKVLIKNTIGNDVFVDNGIKYRYVKWWEIDAIVS